MNNEEKIENLPIPLQDFLCVLPYTKNSLLIRDKAEKLTYGKVLTKGIEAIHTEIGDYVAFEYQDKPEFLSKDDVVYDFVREKDCMCKLPPKSHLFFYEV
jgi:hypothetical protein